MRKTIVSGHKRDKESRSYVLYSIWDNRTDELVILDGTAQQCADMLRRSVNSFYATVSRAKSGFIKRWTITRIFLDEKDEGSEEDD